MSSASKQKPKPPARPPLPHESLSFKGMSFKQLEREEEEEEDLTITDKYSSRLHQPFVSTSVSKSSSPENTDTVKAGTITEKEGAVSFFQKKGTKSVHEYKELLSGWKGRIQEKISKTIEDFSGDSNVTFSEALSKKLGVGTNTAENSKTSENSKEPVAKSPLLKLQKSSTEPLIQLPAGLMARARSEERHDSRENTPPQPVELSLITDEVNKEESIVVSEKSSVQQLSEVLDSKSTLRCRSRVTKEKGLPRSFPTESAPGITADSGDKEQQEDTKQKKNVSQQEQCENPKTAAQTDKSLPSVKSKPVWHFTSLSDYLTLRQQVMGVVFCSVTCAILPLPSFLSGLMIGCMVTSLCLTCYSYLMQPACIKEAPALIPLKDLPPMEIPEIKEATLLDGIYKGWMNEVANYNPEEYHISQTMGVLVTLEGTKLRLQKPKKPIPKRAMYDENLTSPLFVEQRNFELKSGRVSLLPPGLIRKRVWSKKYPLCIALAEPGSKRTSSTNVDSDDSGHETGHEAAVPEEKCDASVLFLFARTSREKEEWFHRFHAATQDRPLANAMLVMRRAIERHQQAQERKGSSEGLLLQRHNSADSQSSTSSDAAEDAAVAEAETEDPVLKFTRYMGYLMPAATFSHLLSSPKDSTELGATARLPFAGSVIDDTDSQLHWLNALIGRCFFDFLRDAWWADKVKDKLQRKLTKIHIPYFIEELQVTAIDLGKEMPVIQRAANPYLDEQGFWVELDVSYSGGFKMTIETKVNLMRLKRTTMQPTSSPEGCRSDRSPVTDPDEEDSAESSTDDEEDTNPEEKESGGGSKKLLKYLNKLTSSKYFQQATEYKYIKRAMENVSNTPLQLQVSVNKLAGKLAINIPPPPSDRLWYGFRGPPHLSLVAKPQVGERVVTITHITDWIERKLELEFQRVFVMPNMDDLVIPILRSSEDLDIPTLSSASDEEHGLHLAASSSDRFSSPPLD
ncbi:hypothetical protein ACOMHN_026755 [Nucella lapillus]